MSIEVRPFRRSDGEQLTKLVYAHVAAVVPGVSVSVNRVLAQLEREPEEFIVDPWVVERTTLVAERRSSGVAAAHLLRYGDDDSVGDSYRAAGDVRWFLAWPDAQYRRGAEEAGDALLAASVAQLVGDLHVEESYRRRGIGSWLVARAADWLCLGRTDRLLAYASPEREACTRFLERLGFRELTRTERRWTRTGGR
jgi:GNAT superfamily N-acetyltransferase